MATLETLPHFRVGESVRFRKRSLDEWAKGQEQTRG